MGGVRAWTRIDVLLHDTRLNGVSENSAAKTIAPLSERHRHQYRPDDYHDGYEENSLILTKHIRGNRGDKANDDEKKQSRVTSLELPVEGSSIPRAHTQTYPLSTASYGLQSPCILLRLTSSRFALRRSSSSLRANRSTAHQELGGDNDELRPRNRKERKRRPLRQPLLKPASRE